jgi:ketosteroid isomerase-like protein
MNAQASTQERNIETLKKIYEAFGRGDLTALLAHVDKNVAWDFRVDDPVAPWLEPVRGHAGVTQFFQRVGAGLEIHTFEPRRMLASGDHVIVDVRIDETIRATGKRVVEEQLEWWTFGADGKVTRLRHYTDTAALAKACLP